MHDRIFRNKITWYSFFFSLLVVWIHAYNAELFLGESADRMLPGMVEGFLGERIGQIAVPGFFMISGYLFYCDFNWDRLLEKWNRRIRSVLVPFILWNGIYYVGYVIGSRLPWLSHVVGKGTIPISLTELTEALLHYKYNPVFWYMYQLIFLIALAPALYGMLKQKWTAGIWFALLAAAEAFHMELQVINIDALIYYSVAAEAAIIIGQSENKSALEISARPFTGIGLLALAVISYEIGLRLGTTSVFVISRLAAVAGLWLLIPGKCFPEAGDVVQHNFFLYATHFAFVRLINKSAATVLPAGPVIPLVLYLLMPGIILGISTCGIHILKRYAPGLCSILNGGRG